MESLLCNEYQLMLDFQKASQCSLIFLPLLFPGSSSNSWFNFQQWFGTKPSPAELINLIFVMNQKKFWGNSDILPFLESFQLLWYFTWNFSFECKIWRNPNINLGLKKFKEFWSYFSTCAGSSVICAFDLGGYSLTGFHVGFFVTSFVLPVIFIILMWANLHLFHNHCHHRRRHHYNALSNWYHDVPGTS